MTTSQMNPEFGQQRAVSVYASGDALDDFPVLKAFQQYIDAEQAKARKRLLAMGVFFGALMLVVIAIFVALLVSVSSRNQQLNDRLIEFAMKDRQPSSAVVVQPPQDSAAVLALTAKLEDLQRKVSEAQSKADATIAEAAEKARQAAAAEAAKAQAETAEQLEIRRLKAQLEEVQKKAAAEREKRREEELEAYRRKHYPELYAPRQDATPLPKRRPMTVETPAEDVEPVASQRPEAPSRTASRDAIDQVLADLDQLERADADRDESDETAEETSPSRRRTNTDEKTADDGEDRHAISVKTGESKMTWGIPD